MNTHTTTTEQGTIYTTTGTATAIISWLYSDDGPMGAIMIDYRGEEQAIDAARIVDAATAELTLRSDDDDILVVQMPSTTILAVNRYI